MDELISSRETSQEVRRRLAEIHNHPLPSSFAIYNPEPENFTFFKVVYHDEQVTRHNHCEMVAGIFVGDMS